MEIRYDINVDVIMLSNTIDDGIFEMTCACIKSINDNKLNTNIFLIESNKNFDGLRYCNRYLNVKFIKPNEEFNYNKYLNIGLKECKSDYIIISNNDLIYDMCSIMNIIKEFRKDDELMSACPKEPNYHVWADENKLYYGYRVRSELVGWCIFIKRKLIDIIGEFDEQFEFFYQDDDYSQTLQKHNIKHALVTNSLVHHLFNRSHRILTPEKHRYYSDILKQKFENKWNIKWNGS